MANDDDELPNDIEPDDPDDFDAEADTPAPPVEETQPPPPPQQLDPRVVESLREQAQRERERADNMARDIAELRAAQQRAQQPAQREPTQEEMSLWTPEQVVDYKLGKASATFNAQLQTVAWHTVEMNDKAAWAATCAADPYARKVSHEVEQRLAELRKMGQNVERDKVYTFILGEKMRQRQNDGKSVNERREQGRSRIERERPKQSPTQSDRGSQRGRMTEQEARRKRLENVVF